MTLTADVTATFKRALVDAAETATAGLHLPDHDLLVRYGMPSMGQLKAYDDIVAVTRISGTLDTATMTANLRTREMTLTADVAISVFRAFAGDDDEPDAESGDRAYALFSAIEEQVRVNDITLGNTVRWCLCISHESEDFVDESTRGRTGQITSSWLAKARITA